MTEAVTHVSTWVGESGGGDDYPVFVASKSRHASSELHAVLGDAEHLFMTFDPTAPPQADVLWKYTETPAMANGACGVMSVMRGV
jgi:hypothetical protein